MKKKVDIVKETKTKNVFDHVNQIIQTQDVKYFDKLSDADKKTWSTYMINRILSMEFDFTEFVNELQRYTMYMENELVYRLYIDIIPKQKKFIKYMKASKSKTYNPDLLDIIKKYYEVSIKIASKYLDDMLITDAGKEYIITIIKKYGYDDKTIKNLLK